VKWTKAAAWENADLLGFNAEKVSSIELVISTFPRLCSSMGQPKGLVIPLKHWIY
jgi:hypothetical protein